MHRTSTLFFSLLLAPPCPTAPSAGWPQFRGPGAQGVAEGEGLPERWSATENVAFKVQVPGRGWSSPIVWEDRVFLTSAVNGGRDEEPKKGLYLGGERKDPPPSVHRFMLYALDAQSGKTVWER